MPNRAGNHRPDPEYFVCDSGWNWIAYDGRKVPFFDIIVVDRIPAAVSDDAIPLSLDGYATLPGNMHVVLDRKSLEREGVYLLNHDPKITCENDEEIVSELAEAEETEHPFASWGEVREEGGTSHIEGISPRFWGDVNFMEDGTPRTEMSDRIALGIVQNTTRMTMSNHRLATKLVGKQFFVGSRSPSRLHVTKLRIALKFLTISELPDFQAKDTAMMANEHRTTVFHPREPDMSDELWQLSSEGMFWFSALSPPIRRLRPFVGVMLPIWLESETSCAAGVLRIGEFLEIDECEAELLTPYQIPTPQTGDLLIREVELFEPSLCPQVGRKIESDSRQKIPFWTLRRVLAEVLIAGQDLRAGHHC